MRHWLWIAFLLLLSCSLEAAPLTLTFAVSGQATLFEGESAAQGLAPTPFDSSLTLTFETSLMDSWALGSDSTMLTWQFDRQPDLDLNFGLPLPTDGGFDPAYPYGPPGGGPHLHLTEDTGIRVLGSTASGEEGTEHVGISWSTWGKDGYEGYTRLLMEVTREVSLSDVPPGCDWLVAILASGPTSFTLSSSRVVDGEYLPGSGNYIGTATLISGSEADIGVASVDIQVVSEADIRVLLLLGLLLAVVQARAARRRKDADGALVVSARPGRAGS